MTDGLPSKRRRKGGAPDPMPRAADAREAVQVRASRLHEAVDAAERLLADCEIFQRGGQLVHITQRKARRGDNSVESQEGIGPAGMGALRYLLARRARFERFDAKAQEFRACDPPKTVVEALMDMPQWANIRDLHQLIGAPVIRPDGSLLDREGYDAATGLYLTRTLDGLQIPDQPSRLEAERANEKLVALFSGFAFADRETPGLGLSVAMSGLFTAVLRPVIRAPAPLIAVTAPKAGNGKSYMVDVIATLATGRRAVALITGSNEEEFEKSLQSGLLAGWPLICLDNLTRPLGGDALNQVLTQERVHARLLGHKKDITIPTSAALFATGNNLRIKGDATRRVLLCTIDCGEEFPEQREFDIDLIADVERRRPELVSAVLTIARWHYLSRPEPRQKGVPFASYEIWASRVRDPLIALGHADPVAALRLARGSDPEAEALSVLAATWTEALGDRELTCREVVAHVTDQSGGLINSDFADALLAVAEQGKGISTKRLGRFLMRYQDRNIGGCSFVRVRDGGHENVVRWALKAIK